MRTITEQWAEIEESFRNAPGAPAEATNQDNLDRLRRLFYLGAAAMAHELCTALERKDKQGFADLLVDVANYLDEPLHNELPHTLQ